MVFIVPGPEQTLAPAIAEIAQGIDKYMKPHREFQVAMQKAVGSNPELAVQLADLEKMAPGTLDRMGFGDFGKALSAIPESASQSFRRKNAPMIERVQTGKLTLEDKQTGFSLDRLEDTLRFLREHPDEKIDARLIMQSLGLPSLAEQAIQDEHAKNAPALGAAAVRSATAGATTAEAQASAAPAVAKATIAKSETAVAESQVQMTALTKIIENYPALKDVNLMRLARNPGSINADTFSALMGTPGASDAFRAAMQVAMAERQEALAERLASETGKNESNFMTQKAFQMYEATGNTAPLSAWKSLLNPDNSGRQKVAEIRERGAETQEEKDLLEAADAEKNLSQQKARITQTKFNTDLLRAQQEVQRRGAADLTEKDDDMRLALMAVQDLLDEHASFIGMNLTARYSDRPKEGNVKAGTFSFEDKGLWFSDAEGRRVPIADVIAPKASTTSSVSEQDKADVMRAATRIDSLPVELRKAALEQLKNVNPELGQQVEAFRKKNKQ